MSSERRARSVLLAIVIWCVILAALGVSYKFAIRPLFTHREPGTSDPRYDRVVNVALDSFSGYCILRSPAVQDQLKAKRIKLNFEDDKADYEGRMKALKSGKVQMAVFTIDSFLVNGAQLGQFPASLVLVIDETNGADAIVAYKDTVGSIRDLDSPDARFVLTPNSPSEFLARTVIAHFSLPSLPEKWRIEADGAGKVYKEFRAARKTEKYAYVMWEPYVSKALEDPGAHILIDSSKLKGYIVDVLVAERKFLNEQPQAVSQIVEAYLRAAYSYTSQQDKLLTLVSEDAKKYGEGDLKPADTQKVAGGILWKNTVENYAHFGLLPQAEMGGLQHIEDIITNIADVLVKTGALREDPLGGKANTIYYDRVLRELKTQNFHPGKKLDLIPGVGPEPGDLGTIREAAALPALTEDQWNRLAPVGELRIPPVSFGRGTADINVKSRRDLEDLVRQIRSFPQYYLVVTGNVRAEGDVEANRQLARDRAQAVAQALTALGLHPNRIRAVAAEPSQQAVAAQSVSFLVGQVPY
jgi:ABC-type nitrate/sulfonate/bicarbonate transport system substrate-binding protein/outer membrane protein OmpA-like peptidoglycan-associated protein